MIVKEVVIGALVLISTLGLAWWIFPRYLLLQTV